MPGAGHIVHMPSHIWYRIGRWRESLDREPQAVAADEALLARRRRAACSTRDGYYAHNVHFMLASALMGGDGRASVEAAEKLAGLVSERAKREVPWTQPIAAAPYVAHARFSAPDAIAGAARARRRLPLRPRALALRPRRGAGPTRSTRRKRRRGGGHRGAGAVARHSGAAGRRRAGARGARHRAAGGRGAGGPAAGDHARAAALFAEAAAVQDRLPYMEPPFWYYPVHQSLGAALLSSGPGRGGAGRLPRGDRAVAEQRLGGRGPAARRRGPRRRRRRGASARAAGEELVRRRGAVARPALRPVARRVFVDLPRRA